MSDVVGGETVESGPAPFGGEKAKDHAHALDERAKGKEDLPHGRAEAADPSPKEGGEFLPSKPDT